MFVSIVQTQNSSVSFCNKSQGIPQINEIHPLCKNPPSFNQAVFDIYVDIPKA